MTKFVNDNGVQFDQQQEDDHFANDTIEVDNDDKNEMMIQVKITTGKTEVETMKGRNIASMPPILPTRICTHNRTHFRCCVRFHVDLALERKENTWAHTQMERRCVDVLFFDGEVMNDR